MSFENIQTVKRAETDVTDDRDEEAQAVRDANPLDSEISRKKHRRLLEWYTQERERQAINRFQMALDEDFYDGLQWAEEDAAILRERGQAPLVFNIVKPTVDWIVGTEKRTRIDSKVLPREEDDVKAADGKSKLLKYLSDTNMAQFERSRSFEESAKAGLGWLEDSINTDPTAEILQTRSETWRNMYHDSTGYSLDGSDWRYVFRHKYLDLDVAEQHFEKRKSELRQAAITNDYFGEDEDEFWYLGQHFQARDERGDVIGRRTFVSDALVYNRRERVKLIECWYREPVRANVVRGELFHGQDFDPKNKKMMQALGEGIIDIFEGVVMRVRVAIFTEGHLLVDAKSPYRHNLFPFTPIWCYRRKRDRMPYGVIRQIRDPQEDYNKRRSKALFLLSVNRVVGDKDAVDDWEELRDEAARPDATIAVKPGRKLVFENNVDLADAQIMLMQHDERMVGNVGGVTDENLGRQTNAVAGKAILARQEQGSVVTAAIFDNLRYSCQIQGQKQLSMIEQFYSQEKVVRILGTKGRPEFHKINEIDEENGRVLNDITARQADFIIGEQDFRQSIRMAMFETLSDIVAKLPPEIAIQLLDLVIDMTDLPDKEEIVGRIRKLNGQSDPDKEMTPEELLERQQMQQEKKEMDALQKETVQAALEKIIAEVVKLRAQAREAEARAVKTGTEAQTTAVNTAAAAVAAPGVMSAADELLRSAGYVDQADTGAPAPQQLIQGVV